MLTMHYRLSGAEDGMAELDYCYRVPVHYGEPVACGIEGHGRWLRIVFKAPRDGAVLKA